MTNPTYIIPFDACGISKLGKCGFKYLLVMSARGWRVKFTSIKNIKLVQAYM